MTQDMTPNRLPNRVNEQQDSIASDPSQDDAALVSLLSDAYEAPPVPQSLVQRLDDGIGELWGESPELLPVRGKRREAVGKAASYSVSVLRSWTVAAGLAASILLAVFLFSGSRNSAWAEMVEAIRSRGVLQFEQGNQTRWLDLSQRVAGSQTSERIKWIDVGENKVWLRRPSDSGSIYEAKFSESTDSITDASMLAAFLSGEPLSARSLSRFSDFEVAEESLQSQTIDGRELERLSVRFEASDQQQFTLNVDLEPGTRLPVSLGQSVQPESQRLVSEMQFAFDVRSAGELQRSYFPDELRVIELSAEDASDSPEPIESLADRADNGSSAGESRKLAIGNAPVDPRVAALPSGPANKWRPVGRVSRTDREVVERVNALLEELWQEEGIETVGTADDLHLFRRAYLDLAGRTPTVSEVQQYLKDDSESRYEELVDRLIDSPDHSSQLAAVWRSFLIPDGIDLEAFGGREAFDKWLAERFEANEPYDQIVRKLLLAEGRLTQSGPLLFYTALKLDADQIASRTSRAFLGMRLGCAQCHDHPFEPWTQEDFWSYAAFFAQISRPMGELENVSTVMRVHDVDRGEVMLPETDRVVPPRFLGSDQPIDEGAEQATAAEATGENVKKNGRRAQLARWLTGPDNPYFARATANRLWSHFFGRGIVDPVDDFGSSNEPVSPELLDTLAGQLIESDFSLKKLIRTIVLSDAYRLASSSTFEDDTEAKTEERLEHFAQMNVKTLTAEQLYDCISVATLRDQSAGGNSTVARFGNRDRVAFLQQFASPAANRSEYLAGIPQALTLMNGSFTSGSTSELTSGLVRSLQAPFFTDRQRVDVLYMATLSRPASNDEASLFAEYVPADASSDRRMLGLADLLWALVNSSEFTLNH